MLFAAIYKPSGDTTEEKQKRSLQLFTSWTALPEGFEFKAHYFRADGQGGIAIVEASSAAAIAEAIAPWTAFFDFEVSPIMDASEGVPITQRAYAWRDSVH